MAMSYHKKPCPGDQDFGRPFLGQHYYILNALNTVTVQMNHFITISAMKYFIH